MHFSIAAVASGANVTYATSSSWPRDGLVDRLTRKRIMRNFAPARLLRKRILSFGSPDIRVVRRAGASELLFQLQLRMTPARRGASLRRYLDAFEKSASTAVKKHDVVFAQYLSAKEIFAKADGLKLLNYPIAHHAWVAKAFEQEAERNPKWSHYLHSFGESNVDSERLDQEIESADYVFVPSSFVRETFTSAGVSASKIVVAPLGWEPASVENGSAGKACWSPRAKLKALYAGQVTQRKGISYLVSAVSDLHDVELLVVGQAMPNIVEELAAISKSNVRIVDSVSRGALRQLMSEADVLVLPSLAEGFPLVAIEAMSVGTPCLLTVNTLAPDLIVDGHNGVIIETGSSESIASALKKLAREPELLALMSKNAAATAQEYTWKRYETQILEWLRANAGVQFSRG